MCLMGKDLVYHMTRFQTALFDLHASHELGDQKLRKVASLMFLIPGTIAHMCLL